MMTTPTSPDNAPQPDPPSVLAEEAIAWFARVRSGRMTEMDQATFTAWRGQSAAHQAAFEEIRSLWDQPELLEAAVELDQPAIPPKPVRRRSRVSMQLVAAAAAVVLVVTAVLYQGDVLLRLEAEYATGVGERHTVTLTDRSTVMLNTDSALSTQFRPDSRHVRLLKGEALFRVQSDPSRPFLVEHRGVVARAVGTAFLVRERQGTVQVTVVEGVVAVQSERGDAMPLSLTAGQQLIVSADGTTAITSIKPAMVLSWTQGRLVFDATPFSEVLAEISRYHAGYIGLWNPALAELRVSGSYNLADTSQVLTTLTQTLPVHMTSLTDRLVVFR